MPSFEDMKKHYSSTHVGSFLKEMSNMAINETFTNNTTYREGYLYDSYLNPIKKLEFKFLKTKTYTISKDQVEYMIQFRPGVNPEIDFDQSQDKKHRLNYYIDVLNENTKEIEKWLIVGKDTSEFEKYLILKCNWTFEWIDHFGEYHSCLGCIRDRNSYNSGVWSDGFTTSVENQTMFIVPTNNETMTIDYNIRFMISDNTLYPKTYEVTKVMDTFPLGAVKVILKQDHYNQHTDLCGIDKEHKYFDDDKIHMVCNFYKSQIIPCDCDDDVHNLCDHEQNNEENLDDTWKLSNVNEYLYVNGQAQTIKASNDFKTNCVWKLYIDNEEVISKLDPSYTGDKTNTFIDDLNRYFSGMSTSYYLQDYFDISIDNNMFSITAINKDMVNYVIKIAVRDADKIYSEWQYDDFVEMEVRI